MLTKVSGEQPTKVSGEAIEPTRELTKVSGEQPTKISGEAIEVTRVLTKLTRDLTKVPGEQLTKVSNKAIKPTRERQDERLFNAAALSTLIFAILLAAPLAATQLA